MLYFWVSDIFNLYFSVISLIFSLCSFCCDSSYQSTHITELAIWFHSTNSQPWTSFFHPWPPKVVGFELNGFIVLKMVEALLLLLNSNNSQHDNIILKAHPFIQNQLVRWRLPKLYKLGSICSQCGTFFPNNNIFKMAVIYIYIYIYTYIYI